jgi:putative membrane protein
MDNQIAEMGTGSAPKPSLKSATGVIKARIQKFFDCFKAGLGIGRSSSLKPASGSTNLNTTLALQRTYWAAERTLQAWIRTALAMISFGFTLGKLGQAVSEIDVKGFRGIREVGVESMAYVLVILGTLALLAAAVQYSVRVYNLSKQGLPPRPSIAFMVASALFVMGGGAFSSLVLKL